MPLPQAGWPSGNLETIQARLRYCTKTPSPKQRIFTMLNTEEAFYGGAGGGGKSIALLMAALQFVDVTKYNALIIRRTYQDLSAPDALMHVALDWLSDTDAHWDSSSHRWTFPSGATLSFGHMDSANAHQKYKGAQYQFVGFDEVSDIPEHQYTFLFTRLRRPAVPCANCQIPLQTDGASWFHDVDQNHDGCVSPEPDKGVLAQYPATDDGLTIFNIPLRMRSASNPGGLHPSWVFNRFVNEESRKPKVVFIPAKVEDNKYLDQKAYEESLQQTDPVLYQQIRHGKWDIRPDGALFKRDSVSLVYEPFGIEPHIERIRYWDLAGTAETPTSTDPDRSAGILLARDKQSGLWRMEDLEWFAAEPAETEQRILKTAEKDGKQIPIVVEAVASWKMIVDNYKRHLLAGYNVHSNTAIKGAKEARAQLVASAWNNGFFSVVVQQNTGKALDQICTFGAKHIKEHDDVVDSLSGAFNWMNRKTKATVSRVSGSI